MGSVGDAYDNAMCESFFATLECELLNRRRFASQAEARMACFSFIEGWYNPVRLHSALGCRSPQPDINFAILSHGSFSCAEDRLAQSSNPRIPAQCGTSHLDQARTCGLTDRDSADRQRTRFNP